MDIYDTSSVAVMSKSGRDMALLEVSKVIHDPVIIISLTSETYM